MSIPRTSVKRMQARAHVRANRWLKFIAQSHDTSSKGWEIAQLLSFPRAPPLPTYWPLILARPLTKMSLLLGMHRYLYHRYCYCPFHFFTPQTMGSSISVCFNLIENEKKTKLLPSYFMSDLILLIFFAVPILALERKPLFNSPKAEPTLSLVCDVLIFTLINTSFDIFFPVLVENTYLTPNLQCRMP